MIKSECIIEGGLEVDHQLKSVEEQLSLLLSFQLSPTDIAGMLQVSTRTVRNRIKQYGLEELAEYSSLSDVDLDAITENV